MGNYASNKSEHLIKKKLRNIPYSPPNDKDFDTLTYETNLDRNEVVRIIESHLISHPDGRMNRDEFCDLYSRLKKDGDQRVVGLSENIFKALGVNEIESESDLITLREFLMIYAITNKGELSKKLEYVVEKYDVNNTQSLEIEEAKEIIQIILDILKPSKEIQSTSDTVRDCFKQMKVIQVVKKESMIEFLPNGIDFDETIFNAKESLGKYRERDLEERKEEAKKKRSSSATAHKL